MGSRSAAVSAHVDMSLDDIIRENRSLNKENTGWHRGKNFAKARGRASRRRSRSRTPAGRWGNENAPGGRGGGRGGRGGGRSRSRARSVEPLVGNRSRSRTRNVSGPNFGNNFSRSRSRTRNVSAQNFDNNFSRSRSRSRGRNRASRQFDGGDRRWSGDGSLFKAKYNNFLFRELRARSKSVERVQNQEMFMTRSRSRSTGRGTLYSDSISNRGRQVTRGRAAPRGSIRNRLGRGRGGRSRSKGRTSFGRLGPDTPRLRRLAGSGEIRTPGRRGAASGGRMRSDDIAPPSVKRASISGSSVTVNVTNDLKPRRKRVNSGKRNNLIQNDRNFLVQIKNEDSFDEQNSSGSFSKLNPALQEEIAILQRKNGPRNERSDSVESFRPTPTVTLKFLNDRFLANKN